MQEFFDPTNPNILIFDHLDSTSLEAKRMIKSGLAEAGQIIWAKTQDKAHGRHGRVWESLEGNLAFSFIIENEKAAHEVAIYPFIAALAIQEALADFNPELALSFKWPNDIFLNGKKLAGILFESEISGGKITKMICGIGLNNQAAPQNLANSISLHEIGVTDIDNGALLLNIMAHFAKYLEVSAEEAACTEIYEKWLNKAHNLGKEIIVISAGEEIRGEFCGIKQGNLVVRTAQQERLIYTGDVFFAEEQNIITVAENVTLNNVTFLNAKQVHK